MDNKDKINLFIGYSKEDFQFISKMIENYKTKIDNIFSNMFLKSFYKDSLNKELMKQWAIFTEKIKNLNKKYFFNDFNYFFPTFEAKKLKDYANELYKLFKSTFEFLFKLHK